jgi:hypothetical protein
MEALRHVSTVGDGSDHTAQQSTPTLSKNIIQ